MKIRDNLLIILLTVGLAAGSVYADDGIHFGTYTPEQFRDYWYNHGAEISRFSLQQMRYGEIHQGDAVLIFVTEEMNPALQVKADNPGPENVPILKLNAVRKFFTGIYPYSIMTSVFTPVDVVKYPLPFKVTASSQEWCGHVYTQLNLSNAEYRVRVHSYFEKEFPFRIQKWEESYRDPADPEAKVMTTRATRTHTIMDAYWQHHGNRDRALLKKLGLSASEMKID